MNDNRIYDLSRFIEAHANDYEIALAELKAGEKTSHWIWYIFPQIAGLGLSRMSRYYAIKDLVEAKAFFEHPVLGENYRECCRALLMYAGKKSAVEILGSIDAAKVRSSVTLFLHTGFRDAEDLCGRILSAFYAGQEDKATIDKMGNE